ncbi:hypothetical protein PHJA_000778800 [Phtheirospermum japonicum]|uniref:Uncharacterized protein n=1 Tax=Phtheirospermum japonicum TaxID=374723 RepID=A0A830BFF4_9LAMI|nr:hypothetical protein PHJA_000778800 [Phtheirospermum japonicum]
MSPTELSEEEKARSKPFKKEEKGSTSSPHKYEYESSDEEIDWRIGLEDIDTQSPKELHAAVGRCFRKTPAVVEAAEKLLKSLKVMGMVARIVKRHSRNCGEMNLLLSYDNDRVSSHDQRMSYVNDDPILKTELGPSAHVMRKAMCLSLLYWFDSAVFETLGLRDFLSQEVEPEIVEIKYKTNCKGDVEILDSQREFDYLVDDMNRCVAWTVYYELEEGFVGAMRISRNIFCWLLGPFKIAKVGHFVLEHVYALRKQAGQLGVGACNMFDDSNNQVDLFSGPTTFTISPPPSSMPLPTFSLRPKLSCRAAVGIDAGATDDLWRLLRLRGKLLIQFV